MSATQSLLGAWLSPRDSLTDATALHDPCLEESPLTVLAVVLELKLRHPPMTCCATRDKLEVLEQELLGLVRFLSCERVEEIHQHKPARHTAPYTIIDAYAAAKQTIVSQSAAAVRGRHSLAGLPNTLSYYEY